jgi:glucan phosphoethanolaminetransferase (alkaline phosphatase superfamily)
MKGKALHRIYLAFPLGLILLDLAVRGRAMSHFAWPDVRIYLMSMVLSILFFRGVEGTLHRLRHGGFPRLYYALLGFVAILWGSNLLVAYAYFAANHSLPDLFTLSYLRWETAHAFVMARDAFRWHHALILAAVIAALGWFLHRACSNPRRFWNLPWWGKLIHGVLVLGLLIVAIANAAERPQSFLPDVNTPAILGRYLWKEYRGQNPPPIRLRPRKPLPIPERFPQPPVNILVILNESLRRQNLQIYGYGRETTPRMKRFLQGHAPDVFLFKRAYTNSSATLLSVPSLFTGISPLQPVEYRTQAPLLWEWAKAAEMKTFLVSSQDLSWCAMDRFLTTPAPDFFWDKQQSGLPYYRDWGIDDRVTVDLALDRLQELAASQQRFLGVIHLNTNHYPYNTAPDYQRWKKNDLDLYDNTILETDTHTDRILNTLEELKLLKNTVVVFASDHGEAFHEHGYIAHFYCHYTETVSVPLWMHLPPVALKDRSRSILAANLKAPVQNLDLMPTLLDLMGIWGDSRVAGLQKPMPGSSLLLPLPGRRDILTTNTDEVLVSPVGLSLIRGSMHYMLRTSLNPPEEDLYNLELDPWEKRNLWKDLPESERWRYREAFDAFPLPSRTLRSALMK